MPNPDSQWYTNQPPTDSKVDSFSWLQWFRSAWRNLRGSNRVMQDNTVVTAKTALQDDYLYIKPSGAGAYAIWYLPDNKNYGHKSYQVMQIPNANRTFGNTQVGAGPWLYPKAGSADTLNLDKLTNAGAVYGLGAYDCIEVRSNAQGEWFVTNQFSPISKTSAYLNTDYNVAAGTIKIPIANTEYDYMSEWSAVNYRYTAKLGGIYHVSFKSMWMQTSGAGVNATITWYIYKNGAAYAAWNENTLRNYLNNSQIGVAFSKDIPMVAGDYIEFYATTSHIGTFWGGTAPYHTWASIHKLLPL